METETELSSRDREMAISILRRRLQPKELRQILEKTQGKGKRRKSVEWIVAEVEHSGCGFRSRLPDEELAAFLVDLNGPDLLSEKCSGAELRYRLALGASSDELEQLHEYSSQCRGRGGHQSQARAIGERPWHPGKGWASHFAHVLGFPAAFAGLAGDPLEPDCLEVEPFRPLPAPEDFQEDLKVQLITVLGAAAGVNRAILTLPTGAGKTRTAVEALSEWRRGGSASRGILWVAQSEELCEQAVQAFREVWIDLGHRKGEIREPLAIHRLWGPRRVIPVRPEVVVASIQKLHKIVRGDDDGNADAREERKQELGRMAEQIGAIVVDEAHRMFAPIYGEVLEFLGVDVSRGAGSPIPLLGLTATPFRRIDEETRRLVNRFHGRLLQSPRLGSDPIGELRGRGVLSQPIHRVLSHRGRQYSLDSDPRFREHFAQFKDFHPELVRQLGQEHTRNRQLLGILRELPADWPTLFFACSVEHAKGMAVLLRRHGRSAATVSAETRPATRRFLVEEFRAGRISVLCNYGVLTTGFDAPSVRAVVISRPTTSAVLYEQMIGRGMRGPQFGGTDECLVIDVEDNIQFGDQAFQKYASYWASKSGSGS